METTLAVPVIREVALDWITATHRDVAKARALASVGRALVEQEQALGNDVLPWHFYGYVGQRCGRTGWGERHDSTLLRLSGALAHQHALPCFRSGAHVSRLDAQVTVWLPPRLRTVGRLTYNALTAAWRNGARKPEPTEYRKPSGSYTCYVGSRTSERFGRVYDKGHESKDEQYDGCWRWEAEYKDSMPERVLAVLDKSEDLTGAIRAIVHRFFADRNCPLPWGPGGPAPAIQLPHTETDNDRRLQWLLEQVAPVVAKLLLTEEPDGLRRRLGL